MAEYRRVETYTDRSGYTHLNMCMDCGAVLTMRYPDEAEAKELHNAWHNGLEMRISELEAKNDRDREYNLEQMERE